jgi:hypothetical protein
VCLFPVILTINSIDWCVYNGDRVCSLWGRFFVIYMNVSFKRVTYHFSGQMSVYCNVLVSSKGAGGINFVENFLMCWVFRDVSSSPYSKDCMLINHHHYRNFPTVINFLFRFLLHSIYSSDVLDNVMVIKLIGDAWNLKWYCQPLHAMFSTVMWRERKGDSRHRWTLPQKLCLSLHSMR